MDFVDFVLFFLSFLFVCSFCSLLLFSVFVAGSVFVELVLCVLALCFVDLTLWEWAMFSDVVAMVVLAVGTSYVSSIRSKGSDAYMSLLNEASILPSHSDQKERKRKLSVLLWD